MKKSNKNLLAFSLITVFCSCSKVQNNYLKQEKGQVESKKYGVSLITPAVQAPASIPNAYPIVFTNPETKEIITFASQNDKSPMFFKTVPSGSDVMPTVDEAHLCNMSVSDQSTAMTKIINATCTVRNALALDPSKLVRPAFPLTFYLRSSSTALLSTITFHSQSDLALTYFPSVLVPGATFTVYDERGCEYGITISDSNPNILVPQSCIPSQQ